MSTTIISEQDQAFKQEWNSSPALRAEFMDSFSAYVAYKQAVQRGAVKINGNKQVKAA